MGDCHFAGSYNGLTNHHDAKLPAGEYLVYVRVDGRTKDTPTEFTIQVYADKKLPCLKLK